MVEEQLTAESRTAVLAALELVPFAMLVTDGSAQVRAVNRRWMELSGLGRANSLGEGWLSVLEPVSRGRLREDLLRVAAIGEPTTADYPMVVPRGERWARWWISHHDLEGSPLVAIAVADVHDDYARQANLYHLATHDALTGLINRSHFIECTEQALRRNERQSRHVGVVYVDLDGFKSVNDHGGHSLGDRILFAIGARLRHTVRSADLVARIGGDEFAVLCEGLNAVEQAEVVAARIGAALAEAVELDGHSWPVSASVGAAVNQGGPDSAEALVDRADRAMYSIKRTRQAADVSPIFEKVMEDVLSGQVSPTPPGEAAAEPTRSEHRAPEVYADPAEASRERIMDDVNTLRESLESIRRMLDRMLTGEAGVIDIRDREIRGLRHHDVTDRD